MAGAGLRFYGVTFKHNSRGESNAVRGVTSILKMKILLWNWDYGMLSKGSIHEVNFFCGSREGTICEKRFLHKSFSRLFCLYPLGTNHSSELRSFLVQEIASLMALLTLYGKLIYLFFIIKLKSVTQLTKERPFLPVGM